MITLKQALVVLAAKPSFHPIDRDYGMRMAHTQTLEAEWTPRMKLAIYDLILRHKLELEAHGHAITEVQRPPTTITQPITPAVQQVVTQVRAQRYVRLEKSGHYTLWSEYNQELVAAIKQSLPNKNRKWNPERRCWDVTFVVSDGRALSDFNKLISDWKFSTTPEAKSDIEFQFARAITDEKIREKALTDSYATDANVELVIPGLSGELRGFQKAGVLYAIEKQRCFIADEMGLGKTVQALATIEHQRAYPAIIVCRAALRKNWVKEIRQWLPERKVTLDPGDMEYRVMQILVISYEGLVKWYAKLEDYDWKSVTADESQFIKNAKAKRTKAVRDIAKVSKAPIRLCLTGTPVDNMPYEFFSQISFLGQWDKMGGSEHCYNYYCGSDRYGAKHMAQFNAELRKHFYIRRLKKDVLTELPPKQRSFVPMEIDNMAEYRAVEKDVKAFIRTAAPNISDEVLEMEEGTAEHKGGGAEAIVKIAYLKQVAMKGMLESAKAWIEEFIESGEKLVVFCHHKEAQRQVYQLFKDVAVWTRNTAGPQAAVDAFQNDPKIKIIVCSLMADNAGHTLTAASNVCFLELGWTPTIHDQAEDRCHRIGQRDNVTAWYLIATGTIYEKIVKLINDKREVVQAATDGRKDLVQKSGIMRDLIRHLTAA